MLNRFLDVLIQDIISHHPKILRITTTIIIQAPSMQENRNKPEKPIRPDRLDPRTRREMVTEPVCDGG